MHHQDTICHEKLLQDSFLGSKEARLQIFILLLYANESFLNIPQLPSDVRHSSAALLHVLPLVIFPSLSVHAQCELIVISCGDTQ